LEAFKKLEVQEITKDLILKICIFGEMNVGKSSLLHTFAPEMFNNRIKPSMYIDIAVKTVIIDSSQITLQIWILGTELSFKFIFSAFTIGASGGIFMFDLTKYSSLRDIEDWQLAFKESLGSDKKEIPIIMVGGKSDLSKERMISRRSAKKLSKKYNFLEYFECSSKTGENVKQIFEFLTRSIIKFEECI